MIAFEGLFLIYLTSAVFFILSIKGLSSPTSAQKGNFLGIAGMILAILATLLVIPSRNDAGILFALISAAVLGIFWAKSVKMTALPQMIALLNGVGGLSSLLVGMAQILRHQEHLFDTSIGIVIGAIAFSGSIIAFFKLNGMYRFKRFQYANFLNIIVLGVLIFCWVQFASYNTISWAYFLILTALIFGGTITMPVGGADMPIMISVLNACSGFAAVGIGFAMSNIVLIITGALVGASGTILAAVMTKAMNKSLFQILFLKDLQTQNTDMEDKIARTASIKDAAFLLENANKVIVVPGFGMASSGAQYALKNMTFLLENKYHVNVKFAIHPVAGRMPGHMNVLLAEAKVDYTKVFALDEINPDFETADVAYVIGANDITNSAAQSDPSSPLYGMPILEVFKAKTVIFVKRSLNAGYAGVENPLFFADNTLMLYGDAKKVTEEIIAEL